MPYKDPIKAAEYSREWERTPKARAKKKEYQDKYKHTPRYKYTIQRKGAIARGIDWLFTFDSWLATWVYSGKWEERGNLPNQYCMCRFGDTGPYSEENVYIATNTQNKKDAYTNGVLNTDGLKLRWT